MSRRVQWASRLGVILAVMGSAVGLGNFLKFPGQIATYGGGFMIPYLIALFAIGVPLCWIEWTMGRAGGARGVNSSAGVLLALTGRNAIAILGAVMPAFPLVIYGYYVVVEAWCLYYAWFALTSGLPGDASAAGALFAGISGADGDGAALANPGVMVCVASCVLLNLAVLSGGIRAGIERLCAWGMPLLVVCAIAVVVRVLTLGPVTGQDGVTRSVSDALGAVWNLDRTVTVGAKTSTVTVAQTLANPAAWLAATAQIFFTLSVGMGVLLTYASYMKRDDDVALASTTAVAGNEFCEVVLGGLMTVPAAVLFIGGGIMVAVPGLFGLGFVTLPTVFAVMPGGAVWGLVFFVLLFLAAVTSSLSMLQPAVAFAEEGLGLSRRKAVTLIGIITLPGVALTLVFSKNFTGLDTMDFWIGNVALLVAALVLTVAFSWLWRHGFAELQRGAQLHLPNWIESWLRFGVPVMLLLLLVGFVAKELVGGGRITAMRDWRVALSAAWSIGLGIGFAWLGQRALPRLRAAITVVTEPKP